MSCGEVLVDPSFEAAVDAIVAGDIDRLARLLHEQPDIVRRRSASGHACTLLHYISANGVEQSRQRCPSNAPTIAQALLDAGAEPDAVSLSYGREHTTLELLLSSCHPAAAGVQEELAQILCRAGARVEGLHGDGSPLWTAITWGYRRAAERLVQCGASVDNILTAAALGDLAKVNTYFDADGSMVADLDIRGATCFTHGRPFDRAHVLEYALITAAGAGRVEVVEFLLTMGPDLGCREPIYNNTALDSATYPNPAAGYPHGHPDVVRVLKAAGAF